MTSVQKYPPVNPDTSPTDRQKRYALALGGDELALPLLDRRAMSGYIDSMLAQGRKADWSRVGPVQSLPSQRHAEPSEPPASVPVRVEPPVTVLEPPKPVEPPFPLELFAQLRNGYYAWQADESYPLQFMRVIERKTGRLKGARVMATQHGPNFNTIFVLYPSGKWYAPYFTQKQTELVLGVISDQKGAAIRYGREKGSCARCNKDLTVERSRWYSIGPDCELLPGWSAIIDEVDNEVGYSFDDKDNVDAATWPVHFQNYLERLV